MIDRLEHMEQRFDELQSQFALPEVLNDHEKYQKTAKSLREIEEPVEKYRELKQVRQGLADARAMLAESRRGYARHGGGGDCFARAAGVGPRRRT